MPAAGHTLVTPLFELTKSLQKARCFSPLQGGGRRFEPVILHWSESARSLFLSDISGGRQLLGIRCPGDRRRHPVGHEVVRVVSRAVADFVRSQGRKPGHATLFSTMGSTTRIAIVADVHERASGVPDALTRLGALVEVASLPAGDYAVGVETVVERKSVLDLHGAILKGRFWPQLGKLRAECEFPYLLVEGRELDRGPLHPNAIRGACLTAMELGIALLRTEDRDDSARWLHRLAVRRQRVERAPDRPAYAQRPKVQTGVSAAEAALAVVPGISVVCARALLARFGSVHAVLHATIDELVTVPGIGFERARALEQTFHRQVGVPTSSEAAASAAMSDRHRSPT